MLHLYLIKNKAARFFLGLAEYLLLFFILNVPWLAHVSKFLTLPENMHISLIIISLILAAMLSVQHLPRSTEEKLAEYEKTRKTFLRDILDYIIMGVFFSLLIILFTLINKIFDVWVWGTSAIITAIITASGTVFRFADKAAYARLKGEEE